MTKIFQNIEAFWSREDRTENGVSPEFAAANPNWEKDNDSNEGCWDCSGCFRCSDCSGCSDCSDCSGCFGCSDCSGCSGLQNASPVEATENSGMKIPVIENIHTKVFEAASKPNALDMGTWHTCDTTHCRAGWVVHLAGNEGRELEKKTSTLFAAMQIYHKSSKIHVSPVRFYEPDEKALADMKKCAEEERVL